MTEYVIPPATVLGWFARWGHLYDDTVDAFVDGSMAVGTPGYTRWVTRYLQPFTAAHLDATERLDGDVYGYETAQLARAFRDRWLPAAFAAIEAAEAEGLSADVADALLTRWYDLAEDVDAATAADWRGDPLAPVGDAVSAFTSPALLVLAGLLVAMYLGARK